VPAHACPDDVLVATDFFTAEVWTLGGVVTYYVLFFTHLGSRRVQVAGVTPHPKLIDAAGITWIPLPPRSPNLNAYAERWVRSVKEECLARLILFGEASLRHALTQYVAHFHHERNHQGKGNVLLFPLPRPRSQSKGPI
jgi:putative transposase